LIELSLEKHKFFSLRRFLVNDSILELLEGVDDFQELAMVEEEVEVASCSLFCLQGIELGFSSLIVRSLTNDSFDWDQESFLVEVSLQFVL
jgi:hypothetical protein